MLGSNKLFLISLHFHNKKSAFIILSLFKCWSFRYGAKFLLQRKVLSVSVETVVTFLFSYSDI